MFALSAAEIEAVQAAWNRGGELCAAVELRRLFPGIADMTKARECARMIAGWTPPAPPVAATVTKRRPKPRATE
jgi:hypothetical protein